MAEEVETGVDDGVAALEGESDADLFESAPGGYMVTLPDGTIVKVNRTFLTLTGYTADDVIGRRFQDLLTAGGRIYHETHYSPLLRMQDSVREIAVDLLRKDGTPLPVLVNASLKRDAAGAPVLVRTLLFEATHRRQYERELLLAKDRAEKSEQRATGLARTLQESLMPPSAPVIDGLEIGTAYRPAGAGYEIGGDFYDFFETATGDWSIVIGDVAGKGAAAAAVTAVARYAIRAAAITADRPSQALRLLNDALLLRPSDRACTAIYGQVRLEGEGVAFSFSVGGHPLPMLVHHSGDVSPAGRPGALLGAFEDVTFTDSEVTVAPGDALVMFTDGVTEARHRDEFFGEQRVHDFLAAHANLSAPDLASLLAKEVLDFQEGFGRDDVAVVVLRSLAR